MNDRELDDLIARAVLAEPAPADSPVLGRGRYELLEEIMTTPTDHERGEREAGLSEDIPLSPAAALPPGQRRRRLSTGQRVVAGFAVAAAFAAAIAVPAVVLRGKDDTVNHNVVVKDNYTAAQRAAAEGGPLVLLDDPAWTIEHVDQDGEDSGEIRFTDGTQELQATWYPADQYQSYYDDRLDVSPAKPFEVLGRAGALFTYNSSDFAVMMPPKGKSFVEYRVGVKNRATLDATMAELKTVTVDEWLAAMPSSVVKPDDEAAVAEQMLEGVPLPPGFDRSKLPTGQSQDYYQFGARVTGMVTCGWLRIYGQALPAGDEATLSQVDAALGTSRTWTVLTKMDAEGDYPDVIWQYADAVHARNPVTQYEQGLDCGD